MTQLIVLVCMYMLVSIGIGLWAARRVRNTADYALAGRSLPLAMVITATFATWFGSETVLGLPGRFIEGGIAGVIEEPFGSGMALILVGMFFARKLYKMDLLTIGDFYRKRYGKKIELACAIFIILSYLGWVGAQVAALGLVLNLVTEGAVLSAVMSTASATMLAPATTFVENVLRNFVRIEGRELPYMRMTLVFFAVAVLTYSLWFEGTAIYDMVAMAYQFPVVGAFWPLVMGLYWKRATTQGAWMSIFVGGSVWAVLTFTPLGEVFPSVLGGFLAAGSAMVVGSLLPTASNARYHRWQASMQTSVAAAS